MDDIQLRGNVIDELDFDPSLDAADIGVTADKGVITLTGHVPNYAQKKAAERAVWRVKGVKAIAQEIEVRIASDKKTHDDEIAQRALNILAWDASVPHDAVHIKVHHGLVTLSGQVNWHYQRIAAEAAVRKLSGVIGIINEIALAVTARASDISQRIGQALKRRAEVEASRIKVEVDEHGKVVLLGEVDNWDELKAAQHAAWSTPGVTAVDDRIRIV